MAEKSGKAMSKSQIAERLANATSTTKRSATQFLDELTALAYKEAKNSFTIPGVGKLVLVNRKARMGRNPATGEEIKIPRSASSSSASRRRRRTRSSAQSGRRQNPCLSKSGPSGPLFILRAAGTGPADLHRYQLNVRRTRGGPCWFRRKRGSSSRPAKPAQDP